MVNQPHCSRDISIPPLSRTNGRMVSPNAATVLLKSLMSSAGCPVRVIKTVANKKYSVFLLFLQKQIFESYSFDKHEIVPTGCTGKKIQTLTYALGPARGVVGGWLGQVGEGWQQMYSICTVTFWACRLAFNLVCIFLFSLFIFRNLYFLTYSCPWILLAMPLLMLLLQWSRMLMCIN